MRALPDEERQEFRHAVANRSASGLDAGEAMARAKARVAGEIARDGE